MAIELHYRVCDCRHNRIGQRRVKRGRDCVDWLHEPLRMISLSLMLDSLATVAEIPIAIIVYFRAESRAHGQIMLH